MELSSNHRVQSLLEDSAAIEAALRRAVRRALLDHKRAGNPICVWRDGQVVWIPPQEIEVPEEEDNGSPANP